MEATTEFHKKVSLEQSSFCIEQDAVTHCTLCKPQTFVNLSGLLNMAEPKAGLCHSRLWYCVLPRSVGFGLNAPRAGGGTQALSVTSWASRVQAVRGGVRAVVLPFPVFTQELIRRTGGTVQVPTAKQAFQGLKVLEAAGGRRNLRGWGWTCPIFSIYSLFCLGLEDA